MNNTLPKESLKEIQQVHKPFIWGDSEESKKVHPVKWDIITNPKNKESLVYMKKSCVLKLGWNLKCGDKYMWNQVLQGKNVRKQNNFAKI